VGTKRIQLSGIIETTAGNQCWPAEADAPPPENAFLTAFVSAPPSPDPFDFDASKATDPDLANNGFLVHTQNSPWTTLTRAGDVDFFGLNPPPPTGNTYQSTLANGLLFLRFPVNVGVAITKQASTLVNGYTLKTHAWLTREFDASNATAGLLLSWYIAGLADPTGKAQYGAAGTQLVYSGILNNHWNLTTWVVGSFPTSPQDIAVGTDFGDVVNYLRLDKFASSQSYGVRAGTPISFLMPAAPYSANNTLDAQRAGLIVVNGTSQIVVIDFIRKIPVTQFP
jgi:hypothetical protein